MSDPAYTSPPGRYAKSLMEVARASGMSPPALSGMAGQLQVCGVTADSRLVQPGFIFAALPGTKADGRTFIAEAVRRGAVAVLLPEDSPAAGTPPSIPLLTAAEPRRALALAAATIHAPQPETVVAVTGTNGKTSTVDFLRQLWEVDGQAAASIGTLGLRSAGFPAGPSLTTPDPVALHMQLTSLATAGVKRVALEASSHGIEQHRLDGVTLAAGGFSNLTRDHLDYHGTMTAYRAAKLRLFDELLAEGAPAAASADMDPETLDRLRDIARRRRLQLALVGVHGDAVRLLNQVPLPEGQTLEFTAWGRPYDLQIRLPGRFQADNLLLALALAVGCGMDAARAIPLLPGLYGVRGRMELAARLSNGAAVYVDYAHTPDALERLLSALRPHAEGRLSVVFGAGGDRDPGKRPLMGAACLGHADRLYVTDDNPRSEDPASIRAAILAACPGAREIGDRAAAIAAAMSDLGPGDVLAVAGKGHESGQTVAGVTHPFDDAEVVRSLAGISQ